MTQGRAYTPGDADVEEDLQKVKIRADGSVESPDVLSPEAAAKLQEDMDRRATGVTDQEQPPLETEEERAEREKKEKEQAAETPGQKAEREKKDKEETEKAAKELDQEITIGGEKHKLSELLEQMEKEYGDVDTSTLSPEARLNMLEAYIDHKHKGAWQRSQTQTAQEQAEEKRRLAEQGEKLKGQEEEIRQRRAGILSREAEITARLSTITRDIESLKTIAAKEIKVEDTKDGDGNMIPEKFEEYIEVKQARARLAALEASKQTVGQEADQAAKNRLLADVELFLATHPQYVMGEPLAAVIRKVEEGQYDHPDRDRLLDIYDIIDYHRDHNIPLDVAFQRLEKKGQLTVKLEKPPVPTTTAKQTEHERLVAAVAAKQKGAQFIDTTGNQNKRPQLPRKESLGDLIRESSRRAMSGGSNEGLDKLGF
jgi:myosin heavy subunit